MWYTPESVFTHTIPLPAGGAAWLVLAFGASALLDFAGFVVAAEFDEAGAGELAGAGAAADLVLEEAGAGVLDGVLDDGAAAADLLFEDDFVEAVSAGAAPPDEPASAEDFADFDFFVLAVFVPVSEVVAAVESAEESLAAFDFFELAVLVPESALAEAVESAEESLAAFDFFELAVLLPASALAEAVESAEESFAVFDFFALADDADPLADFESLSASVDFDFFDFDVDDLDDASAESAASVDFFFDLLVFLAGVVVLESLESDACALTGVALASPQPSPAEIKNANT